MYAADYLVDVDFVAVVATTVSAVAAVRSDKGSGLTPCADAVKLVEHDGISTSFSCIMALHLVPHQSSVRPLYCPSAEIASRLPNFKTTPGESLCTRGFLRGG